MSLPEEGTYLSERQRSPRYWLDPSSTGARSFHSWTGPARSTCTHRWILEYALNVPYPKNYISKCVKETLPNQRILGNIAAYVLCLICSSYSYWPGSVEVETLPSDQKRRNDRSHRQQTLKSCQKCPWKILVPSANFWSHRPWGYKCHWLIKSLIL